MENGHSWLITLSVYDSVGGGEGSARLGAEPEPRAQSLGVLTTVLKQGGEFCGTVQRASAYEGGSFQRDSKIKPT